MTRQGSSNQALEGQAIGAQCQLDPAAAKFLNLAATQRGLSGRAIHRCLKVVRTIADLVSRHEEIDADNGGGNITKSSSQSKKRAELQEIAGKGMHAASKVINALILLNCDQSSGRTERPRTCDIATMLCASERKVDRIKKKFVLEGPNVTLNRQPFKCEYDLKIDGRLEAQLLDMSCSAPPEGQARWSLRLLADRLVELEYIDSVSHETVRRAIKKTNSSPGGRSLR